MNCLIDYCEVCTAGHRLNVKAVLLVLLVKGKRVCAGCARELVPNICTRGCGNAKHAGGCTSRPGVCLAVTHPSMELGGEMLA